MTTTGGTRRLSSIITTMALMASSVVALAAVQVATAPAAQAATGDYKVTLVARQCPPTSDPGKNNYKYIRANRARNNIQETLKNLGPDSNYTSNMIPPVNPVNEGASPQDVCTPITNWPLTTSSKIDGKSPAPLNYLSKVGPRSGSDPVNTYRTVASTPELDSKGQPTGRSIAGAVTVSLTDQQAGWAGSNSLWVMGGTRNDPLGEAANGFGPTEYAFGALRCGSDALNGDNVEWVGFKNGATHVFCYALYVTPPEPNGQIIIRKSVAPSASGGGESFGFVGNISFYPGGTFSLKDGERFDERRGVGTWSVTENVLPAGWLLSSIDCSATTGVGTSAVPNLATRSVAITLAEDGVVDCTYVNDQEPPPVAGLRLSKVSLGATGAFPFTVTGPSFSASPTLTTTVEGVSVSQDYAPVLAGSYVMTETLPTSTEGTWDDISPTVTCVDDLGAIVLTTGSGLSRTVVLGAGRGVECIWTNTFTPRATLLINAKTIGGTNAAINYTTFAYDPIEGACGLFSATQDADTTGDPSGSTFHPAQPVGDLTDVRVATWCIAGTRPTEGADPSWVTKSIVCTGDIDYNAPFDTSPQFAAAIVRALPGGTVTCDFTYVKRGTVDLTKAITAGNSDRDGPVTVSLDCPASAALNPAEWPKVLTVGTGASAGTLSTQEGGTIYVDGDDTGADSCEILETDTGGAGADPVATLAATWKGATWAAGTTQQLTDTKSAAVTGTASNSNPVTISVSSGPCAFAAGAVTANAGTGTCVLQFSATGNPGAAVVTTDWSSTINGSAEQGGTGLGGPSTARAVAAGQALVFGVTDSYTRPAAPVTTTRSIDLQALPTVEVAKTVTGGDTLRTGPVTVSLTCAASAAADPGSWPKVLTVPVGQSSGSLTAVVPGDDDGADTCRVQETANGAGGAQPQATITARWKGTTWSSGTVKSLQYLQTAAVSGTASNGKPVTVSVTSGACTYAVGTLTAKGSTGTCAVRFRAPGNQGAVTTTTAWESTIDDSAAQSGTGAGGADTDRAVAAGQALAFAVTDSYTAAPTTVTTTRTVQLERAPQPPVCTPTSSVKRRGTTVLVACGGTTGGGKIEWGVTCRPRGLSSLGDITYCKVSVGRSGKVTIRTFGYHLRITLTGTAPARGNYAAWKGIYRWRT